MSYRNEADQIAEIIAALDSRVRKIERGDQFGGVSSFGTDSRVAAGVSLTDAGLIALVAVNDAFGIGAAGTDLATVGVVGVGGRLVQVAASFNVVANNAAPGALTYVRAELTQDGAAFAERLIVSPAVTAASIIRPTGYGISAIVPTTQNQHTYGVRLTWVDDGGAFNGLADSVNNGIHQLTVADVGTQTT